jgi:hypothetical protein
MVAITCAIVQAVQLISLGSHILHDVEKRIRTAVFGVAAFHKVVVAHPGGIAGLVIDAGNEIPDSFGRPGSKLLAFDRAEFDVVALVYFFVNVIVVIVPCWYGQSFWHSRTSKQL